MMRTVKNKFCASFLWLLATVVLQGSKLVEAAIPIHLPHITDVDSVIFNCSVEEAAQYNLHPTLTPDVVKTLVKVEKRSGVIKLKSELDCNILQLAGLNPFYMYVEYSSRTTQKDSTNSVGTFNSFQTLLPLSIFVHGSGCHPQHDKRKDSHYEETHMSRADAQISRILVELPESHCWTEGDIIVNFFHFLPSSFISLCHPECSLQGGSSGGSVQSECSSGMLRANKVVQCLDESSLDVKAKLTISQHCLDGRHRTFAKLQEEIIPFEIEVRATRPQTEGSTKILKRSRRQSSGNRAPMFTLFQFFDSVPENEDVGYIVTTITATDVDNGESGRLTYNLVAERDGRSQSMFTIDRDTGTISTSRVLDREVIATHYFRIVASDHGNPPREASAFLEIQVEDRNDHRPEFEMSQYHVEIEENTGLTQVIEVHAIDEDSEANGDVRYTILNPESPNDVFSIQPRSGAIRTTESLNRELHASYLLIIQAKDSGTIPSSLNSTAEVIITVLDKNDNSPQFESRNYEVSVPEDVDPYSSRFILLSVVAVDADAGRNSEIRYNMLGGNTQGKFSIDPISGDITLTSALDYEVNSVYRLNVRAQDGGTPSRSATTLVTVSVEDVNDNAPIFPTTLYQRAVREDVRPGYSVDTVTAFDADHGSNSDVRYTFQNPSPSLPFEIDSQSGQITTTVELDREDNAQWDFFITATDMGIPPQHSTVKFTIVISDVNDNPPSFERDEYQTVINENVNMGATVITLTATDPDEGNSISYAITAGNLRNRFSILSLNNEGIVSVAFPLDYGKESRFVLTVEASDGQYSSYCNLIINVTDVNNYHPVFDQSPYSVVIREDVEVGTSIAEVHATDNDFGENARITYAMEEPLSSPEFEIDEDTGIIKTLQLLDRETRQSYVLYVNAFDNGAEPLMDRTEVEIYLTDVNDNAPVFSQEEYSVSIMENAGIHSSVLQVSATDADYGVNSYISYRFAAGQDGDGAFVIDDSAGIIRVAKNLDREETAEYRLVAVAVDGGEDVKQTAVPIVVRLEDMNDNAPVFESSEIHAEIEENKKDGEYVTTVIAEDPDVGPNALVVYNLEDGDTNSFSIDSRSGVVTTAIPLDYEEKREYRVKVRATSSPFFKDATLIIHVLDVNDNPPVLENFEVIFNNYQGHFEDGVIGTVPAMDPDVSDVLEYKLLNGNQNSHLLVNETTGDLMVNPTLTISDLSQRISFVVEVTDGENPVRATCTFHLTMVDDDMLHNSVTVQLADVSMTAFLSTKLDDFIDTLSDIIPTNRNFIYVFSLRDVIENGELDILNVTFAAKYADNNFFSSQYLQERVYLNRSQLSSRITATILPFGDNICLWEVCSDYYDCVDTFSFWLPGPFISTNKVIFRSIHPESIHKCDCPLGFAGNYCTTEVNFCYSYPCKNNGKCVQKEAGYTCICEDGFAGVNCEVDLEENYCQSPESFCKNGGVCRSYLHGGFTCNCSREQDGPFCEIRTRNFGSGSYMTFWSLNQRVRLHISLSFATKQQNGLLFYNGRYNHQHDFIALEIVDGAVKFSFSTGIATTTVSASIKGGVSDGKWHTVTVDYLKKEATIILDDCNPLVALNSGLEDYDCAGYAVQHGERRFLDLDGPFILGGLPSLLDSFPVSQKGFQGCIRDVYIDHVLLDLATSLADIQTQPGCVHLDDFCLSDPCHSGGTCVSEWDRYACLCRKGSSGRNCHETVPDPVQLDGTGSITFDLSSSTVSLPWDNRIGFRTRSDGVLMSIELSSQFRVELKVSDGHLVYSTRSNPTALTLSSVKVNDGQWHNVLVTWKNNQIVMSLDYDKVKKSINTDDTIEGRSIESCSIGNRRDRGPGGLRGCLQAIEVGGVPLLPDEGSKDNIVAGCLAPDLCSTVSCPPNSRCVDLWDTHKCECDQGYYGPDCLSACSLRVCQHGSTCRMAPSEPMGYVCQCSSQFFGDHCEFEIEDCPPNFWGYKLCGPCQCDQDRGFSRNCNKTTGECICQENSYRPKDSDLCYPCNCYSVGSELEACDEVTGQCKCKRNVIGRQCDSCTDPYAEVTIRGCEVVYDSCPKRYTEDIWWPRTKFGRGVTVDCPDGSTGYATRHCDYSDNWNEPNLLNCTSDRFYYLLSLDLAVLEPQTSAAIAFSLWEATSFTPSFFASDVYIAYKILVMLLRHESKQVGVNVTATIKSEYKKHIIESVSHLLDPAYKHHWMQIQETERGTAELMELLEMFAVTIARTSQSFSYTPQFAVISPNIILQHDIIVRENVSTVTVPRLEITHNVNLHNEITHIHIPGDAIEPKPEVSGYSTVSSNVAFSSFIQYNTIGTFLPNRTDDTVRPSKGKVGQVINTPVVSFTIYDELANPPLPNNLTTPIIIEMVTNDAVNRSGKQCIFWDFDYDNGTGGWSTTGCQLIGYNRTHVNCSCSHLTNFATMMDRAPYEVRSDIMVPLHLITYVGAGIGVIFLVITFFILLCLPNLHCNLNSIHINFVFMLIAAELTFLVGVNTEIVFACTIVSICLHFLLLGAFSWMFIEAVHLYRMMTEVRNINMGPMTTYYIACYGIPGLIVGLAVPLSNVDYGPQTNAQDQFFCWLSIFDDMLIWSFAGPVLAMVALNVIVFVMAISTSLRSGHKDPEFNSLKAGLRAAGILLPLLGITWVFGLLAVNQGMLLYQIFFALCSLVLGVSIFIFYCILDSTVRLEILRCCFHVEGKKSQMDSASSRSALSYSKDTPSKFNIGISTGSLGSNRSSRQGSTSYHPNGFVRKTASTTTNVTPSSNVDYVPPYYKPNGPTDLDDPRAALLSGNHSNLLDWDFAYSGSQITPSKKGKRRRKKGGDDDSESDSEASVQQVRDSMSLASSHSSDDDEGDFGDWRKIPRNEAKMPDAVRHVPVHSTPKDKERRKKNWPGEPITHITESDRKAGIGQRAEMKILDPKLPPDKGANSPTGSGGSGSVESQTKIQLVSQRPDILPLKGIMKKPKSDQGSYNGSMGSNLSLARKPQIISSQEKIAVVVNNRGDSDHETSV